MNCIICGKEFIKKNWKENTCSLTCRRERRRITIKLHQQKNPVIYRKAVKKYYEAHKEEIAKYKKERLQKFKQIVLQHYGQTCACCGESNTEFLTVDHINGEGNKHRKKENYNSILEWLIRNNLPDGFQVLCMNCNFVKDTYNKPFCKVHHPELYK